MKTYTLNLTEEADSFFLIIYDRNDEEGYSGSNCMEIKNSFLKDELKQVAEDYYQKNTNADFFLDSTDILIENQAEVFRVFCMADKKMSGFKKYLIAMRDQKIRKLFESIESSSVV